MTQAAAQRGVSQPGISRTIRDLETRLKARLLRRTGRGVDLTPAGTEFLAFARESLAALDKVERRMKEMAGALPDRLSIAVPVRVGGLVFGALYRRFHADMPEVSVSLVEALTEDIADGLLSGRFDFAVSYIPTGQGGEAPTFQEKLYLIGPEALVGAVSDPISVQQASMMPILLNDPSLRFGRLVDAAFQSAGVKLHVTRVIERAEGLLAFASEGEGVTILPYSNFHQELARGEIAARLLVDPQIERGIYLHAARHLDPRAASAGLRAIRRALEPVAEQARWSRHGESD